jgi:hypothetical protein
VKLLEAKRALRYGLYQLTGISDRELFDHRASLAKAGRHIVGALYLPDGTEVGTVLSMFSMPTQGADAAAEIQWHDASGYELAKTGDLSIKDDRVTLVEADSMRSPPTTGTIPRLARGLQLSTPEEVTTTWHASNHLTTSA